MSYYYFLYLFVVGSFGKRIEIYLRRKYLGSRSAIYENDQHINKHAMLFLIL
jgi:hypothetical protein